MHEQEFVRVFIKTFYMYITYKDKKYAVLTSELHLLCCVVHHFFSVPKQLLKKNSNDSQ